MKLKSYYGPLTEEQANRVSVDVPLLFNCAGVVYSASNFYVRRKRKDYYLIFAVGGEMNIIINEKKQTLKKNTFIVIEPETYFEYSSQNSFINYYWLHFTGNYAESLIQSFNIELNTVYTSIFNDTIKELFENIFNEYIFSNPFYETKLCGLLIEILTQISRARTDIVLNTLKSVEFINEHYNENITVKMLAEMDNMSISYFRTIFKRTTGSTPSEYLTVQRINAACLYFQFYNMTVKEVSYAVGYNDSLYFSKVFKKITGISPKSYIKSKINS